MVIEELASPGPTVVQQSKGVSDGGARVEEERALDFASSVAWSRAA